MKHKYQKYGLFFSLLALTFSCAQVLADNNRGFFVGGNLGYNDASDLLPPDSADDNLRLGSLELMGGYKYNSWLAVDIRTGTGLSEQSVDTTTTTRNETTNTSVTEVTGRQTHSIDSYQSIYYRPEMINKKARWYGLFGFTQFSSTVEAERLNNEIYEPLGKAEISESSISLGMGAGWFVNDQLNFNIELKSLVNTSDAEVNTISAGFDYRF